MNNNPMELITVRTDLLRDKHKHQVYNRVVRECAVVVYVKRSMLGDMPIVPYGYRH